MFPASCGISHRMFLYQVFHEALGLAWVPLKVVWAGICNLLRVPMITHRIFVSHKGILGIHRAAGTSMWDTQLNDHIVGSRVWTLSLPILIPTLTCQSSFRPLPANPQSDSLNRVRNRTPNSQLKGKCATSARYYQDNH